MRVKTRGERGFIANRTPSFSLSRRRFRRRPLPVPMSAMSPSEIALSSLVRFKVMTPTRPIFSVKMNRSLSSPPLVGLVVNAEEDGEEEEGAMCATIFSRRFITDECTPKGGNRGERECACNKSNCGCRFFPRFFLSAMCRPGMGRWGVALLLLWCALSSATSEVAEDATSLAPPSPYGGCHGGRCKSSPAHAPKRRLLYRSSLSGSDNVRTFPLFGANATKQP